jgi:DNA-binding NarL/FixJ family response regulator
MNDHPIRVYLVDDHLLFRHGLRLMLAREPGFLVVGEGGKMTEVLSSLETVKADCFILDVHLPDGNGEQLATEILRRQPEAKVLMLSSDSDAETARSALQKGARGYILKDEAPQDLIHAIRSAMNGGVYLGPTIAAGLLDDFLQAKEQTKPQLSERELAVLVLTARGQRTKEIAAALGIGSKTVETYRRRVMQKLGLKDVVALVRYAVREGLVEES